MNLTQSLDSLPEKKSNTCRQLLERVSNKNVANMRKREFGNKLHFNILPPIIRVSKREQVWCLGVETLLAKEI